MVNAWSLAASILNGTFDEDYPIVKKEVDEKTGLWKEPDPVEHSDAYYDTNVMILMQKILLLIPKTEKEPTL